MRRRLEQRAVHGIIFASWFVDTCGSRIVRAMKSRLGAKPELQWLRAWPLQEHHSLTEVTMRKKSRRRNRGKKKDPVYVDGQRPRPMYVDYKDLELLSKMISRHSRIVGRRKSGCSAASQHAVTSAIKRARYLALLPYVGE